ncbi:HAD family hydrolase [Microbacterium sp. LRZ72]|uniref:HAD family hydrolase n=1 Tax=Microbacterium sp. LRZ72 TaxID=2942481 RepID=UPI0039B05540
MDGTLVDTEPHWIAAETPLVESFGGTWSHEQALQLVGLGLEDAARIFQDAGVRMSVHDIIDTLTDRVLASLAAEGVPFRPGARELLLALKKAGIPTALVTMSMRRMATSVVDLIDFDAFDLIVAGDDVSRPKPYPDPYLEAARQLGIDITDTVAIEDSPNGVRSAVAAECTVLGVPNIVSLEGSGAFALAESLVSFTPERLSQLHAQRRGGAHRAGATS